VRIFSSRRLKGSGNAIEAITNSSLQTSEQSGKSPVLQYNKKVVLGVSDLTRMKNCSRASDLKLVYASSAADLPRCLTHEHRASAPYRESIRAAMCEPFYR
jgi:hypothetical protein